MDLRSTLLGLRDRSAAIIGKAVLPLRYHVQFINPAGFIVAPPHVMACDSDREARTKAETLIRSGCDVELWQGGRLVELFPHKQTPEGTS